MGTFAGLGGQGTDERFDGFGLLSLSAVKEETLGKFSNLSGVPKEFGLGGDKKSLGRVAVVRDEVVVGGLIVRNQIYPAAG